jgi:hypothetical protein
VRCSVRCGAPCGAVRCGAPCGAVLLAAGAVVALRRTGAPLLGGRRGSCVVAVRASLRMLAGVCGFRGTPLRCVEASRDNALACQCDPTHVRIGYAGLYQAIIFGFWPGRARAWGRACGCVRGSRCPVFGGNLLRAATWLRAPPALGRHLSPDIETAFPQRRFGAIDLRQRHGRVAAGGRRRDLQSVAGRGQNIHVGTAQRLHTGRLEGCSGHLVFRCVKLPA